MSPPVPFGIRALALSHARAWPTALWTGVATAFAVGLDLTVAQWLVLAGLVAVCGSAVRMATGQLVGVWLALHADVWDILRLPPTADAASDYDAATMGALRALTPPAPPPSS